MSKRFAYSPIGNELGKESAFIQAGKALDAATNMAVESRDIDKLITCTAVWMDLASRLANGGISPEFGHYNPGHDDDDEEDDEPNPFGFAPSPQKGEECQD